jgi:glycosyltransferase involved in cell wall biosynthesis
MDRPLRVLLIAEAANPEWTSVPLVGWAHARALGEVAEVHVVTQERNREALERAGWREGREFTALDSEAIARPLWRLSSVLRTRLGLGWTVDTALASAGYYHFEHLVWRRFARAMARGRFDVVHRLTPLSPTTPSLLAPRCRGVGVPFVLGPLNGGIAWPAAFRDVRAREGDWLSSVRGLHRLLPGYGATLRSASAILTGSRATREQVPAAHQARCVYLPENGVDPERFGAARVKRTGPLKAIFVGRLVPYKGADMLLEAAEPLLRSDAIHLEIVGDGPERARLEAVVATRALGRQVKLTGFLRHAEVAARMQAADLFVFPSVREFGGAVVLEAMASGAVPIVVDYGGPAELVTAETGFRIPMTGREALIGNLRETLLQVARHQHVLGPMGERARARALSLYSWPAKARQVLRVYRWVLGQADKPDFGMPLSEVTTPPSDAEPPLFQARL